MVRRRLTSRWRAIRRGPQDQVLYCNSRRRLDRSVMHANALNPSRYVSDKENPAAQAAVAAREVEAVRSAVPCRIVLV